MRVLSNRNGNENVTLHMRYKSWYISSPPSAKQQQRKMTKYWIFWTTWTLTAKFYFFFKSPPGACHFPFSVKAFFVTGHHHFWLFQKMRECEDGMTSLFLIILSILPPGAECLEYIPYIPESE